MKKDECNSTMSYSWQSMSIEEYVAYQRSIGEKVVKIGDIFWRRVRPLFYRPLLPYVEQPPESTPIPLPAWFGGYQFAVPKGVEANSSINLLMYESPGDYSLGSLDKRKRNQIKAAENKFQIRRIESVSEFSQKAYPLYLSFYERTRYEYRSDRRNRKTFNRWADSLFQHAKVAICGAYRDGELGAVNISELVGNTLIYSTGFCDTPSLRLHITSYFLHSVIQAAGRCPGIQTIFIGPYKYRGGNGVDRFFFERGCSLVKKPALLRLNPMAAGVVKHLLPQQYQKLVGRLAPLGTKTDFRHKILRAGHSLLKVGCLMPGILSE